MYCKRSSEILTDANRKILSEKVQLVKLFSTESEFFSEIVGKIRNRGEMHHCFRGMDAPVLLYPRPSSVYFGRFSLLIPSSSYYSIQ